MADPRLVAEYRFRSGQPLTEQDKSLLAQMGLRRRSDGGSSPRLQLGHQPPIQLRSPPSNVMLSNLSPSQNVGGQAMPTYPPSSLPSAHGVGGPGRPLGLVLPRPPQIPSGSSLGGPPGRSPPLVTSDNAARHGPAPAQGRPAQGAPKSQADAPIQTSQPRMMSKHELVEGVGHAPKFGLGRSTHYKAVLDRMEDYNKLLAKTRVASDGQERAADTADLRKQLGKVDKAVNEYLELHPNSDAMNRLRADISKELALLKEVASDSNLDDPAFNNRQGFTFQQALELKRYGIAYTDHVTFDEVHTDSHVKQSNEDFASGKMNTVAKIKYDDGQTKILKREGTKRAESAWDAGSGIDKHRPHYGNRNIATAALDQILHTNVITSTKYVIHNNRLYTVMDMAPGVDGNGEKQRFPAAKDSEAFIRAKEAFDGAKALEANPRNRHDLGAVARFLEEQGDRIELDAHGNLKNVFVDKLVPYAINYNDPKLAKALNNLEWLDYITGQGDRHPGNFFMNFDKNGAFLQLYGIDNDGSFGRDMDDPEKFTKTTMAGYNGIGLPVLISKGLADLLRHPSTWKMIEASLNGLLTKDEVTAAKGRYDKAVDAIKHMPPERIVRDEDWSKASIPHTDRSGRQGMATPVQVLLDSPEKSYLGRNQATLERRQAEKIPLLPLPH
jgi:hypothetical protein